PWASLRCTLGAKRQSISRLACRPRRFQSRRPREQEPRTTDGKTMRLGGVPLHKYQRSSLIARLAVPLKSGQVARFFQQKPLSNNDLRSQGDMANWRDEPGHVAP